MKKNIRSPALRIPPKWMERAIEILLIGVGGTGTHLLDALFQMHTCLTALGGEGLRVTAIDGDVVSPNNIGRQRFWLPDVGSPKAITAIQRYNLFGGTHWEAIQATMNSNDSLSDNWDVVITAVDDGALRAQLGHTHRNLRTSTLWLDTGVGGNEGQVILGHLGNAGKSRIPNVYDLYGDALNSDLYNPQRQTGSCGTLRGSLAAQSLFANRLAADIASDLLLTLIRQGTLAVHGAFFEVSPITVRQLAIDSAVWRTFPGYNLAA